MKVVIDTNVLISAFLYPDGIPSRALLHAVNNHTLLLSDYNISELYDVAERKFPGRMSDIDAFLTEFSYELIIAPISPDKRINDPKDAPVLNAVIIGYADVLISGDHHFHELSISRPKLMTAAKFLSSDGQLK